VDSEARRDPRKGRSTFRRSIGRRWCRSDFREVLPWYDSWGDSWLLSLGELGVHGGRRGDQRPIIGLRIEGPHNPMSGAPRNPLKRDVDRARPSKSWRQIRLPLIGQLGQLELIVVVPLVLTVNVMVATIVWFVVGSLSR
jgi:hypothetical protein